ncbi:MAG: hypothetical protein WC413_01585 [Candidatus Nanoarchaeia archaeon]
MELEVDWNWFKEHLIDFIIILGVILIISKIDFWMNGENAMFLKIISPFIKSLLEDALIVIIILLLAFYIKLKIEDKK